jgi:hypothetical protein
MAKYTDMTFKTWLEGWEMFGFEKKPDPSNVQREPENPIDQFDIEALHDFLVERNVGQLRAKSKYVNEVVWGEQPGAIRYWIGPGYLTFVDRLGTDLEGNRLWYTKQLFQINRGGYGGYERIVAQEMFERLEEVYDKEPDSPSAEYKGLKALVMSMTDKLRKTCRPIFMLDKIVEHSQNRYMICFSVRGQGVEAPGHQRVEQLTVDMNYYPEKGYIRGLVYSIESPTGGAHEWAITPSSVDLNFLPSQHSDEIVEPIAMVLRYY